MARMLLAAPAVKGLSSSFMVLVFSTAISFFAAALSNSVGVGGGGVFVPMFNVLLGYDPKTSTALSKAMVMGGAVASVCYTIRLKTTTGESSLINYDVARLMQPMLLLGISAGVLLNVLFPAWAIIFCLCALLLTLTWKTTNKGINMWKKEQAAAELSTQSHIGTHDHQVELHSSGEKSSQSNHATVKVSVEAEARAAQHAMGTSPAALEPSGEGEAGECTGGEARDEEHDPLIRAPSQLETSPSKGSASPLEESFLVKDCSQSSEEKVLDAAQEKEKAPEAGENAVVCWKSVVALVLVWALFLVIQIAKSSVPNCSAAFWVLTLSQIPVALVATVSAGLRLRKEYLEREGDLDLAPGNLGEGAIPWGTKQVVTYPLYAFGAGVTGGMLGIGGGMVMGPAMLELGIKPQVVSATSTFMILFSSSISVVEFYLIGMIPIHVAGYFCIVAACAALVGQSVLRSYISRSGKSSIIVILLGVVIGVGGVLLGTLGTLRVYGDWRAGVGDFGFTGLCNSS